MAKGGNNQIQGCKKGTVRVGNRLSHLEPLHPRLGGIRDFEVGFSRPFVCLFTPLEVLTALMYTGSDAGSQSLVVRGFERHSFISSAVARSSKQDESRLHRVW